MLPGAVFGISAGLALAILAVLLVFSARSAKRQTAAWVVSQLPDADQHVTRWVGTLDHVWNPAKPPGVDSWLFGPGYATYSREVRPDGDVIHLDFLPSGEQCPVRHSGPIPAAALAGTAENLRGRQSRRAALSLVTLRFAILAIAIGLAIFVVPAEDGPGIASLGVVLAMVVPWMIAWFIRRRMRQSHPSVA